MIKTGELFHEKTNFSQTFNYFWSEGLMKTLKDNFDSPCNENPRVKEGNSRLNLEKPRCIQLDYYLYMCGTGKKSF